MTTIYKAISVIIAVAQSKWMPTLMTVALLFPVLGADGCGKHAH